MLLDSCFIIVIALQLDLNLKVVRIHHWVLYSVILLKKLDWLKELRFKFGFALKIL